MCIAHKSIFVLIVLWLSVGFLLANRWRFLFFHEPSGYVGFVTSLAYWLLGPILLPAAAPVFWIQEHIQSRGASSPKNWDLFLSYSHWDCLWASAVYGAGRFAGAEMFLDFVVIQRDSDWKEPAERGIRESDIVVLFNSPDATNSVNVQHEVVYRQSSYRGTRKEWRDKPVIRPYGSPGFPSQAVKSSQFFRQDSGIASIPIPQTEHPDWKYLTPPQSASKAVGNIEGWLEVNLPAVEEVASALGLPCPPREQLDRLMREYLEWAAGGRTPLRYSLSIKLDRELCEAAESGDAKRVQELIDLGADIEAHVPTSANTPLILAAKKGHLETLRLLMRSSADVDVHGQRGKTALILAAQNGNNGIVKELIAGGAKLDLLDNNQTNALMWAVKGGSVDVVKALVVAGADVGIKDANGQTALYRAKKKKAMEMIGVLEDAGATE